MSIKEEKYFTYKDLDLNLYPHPLTKDLVPITNASAIKQAIRNILMSEKYCGLGKHYLFEHPTALLGTDIEKRVEFSLKKHEPRIKVRNISVSLGPNESGYKISVHYKVVSTEIEDKLDYFFKRVR